MNAIKSAESLDKLYVEFLWVGWGIAIKAWTYLNSSWYYKVELRVELFYLHFKTNLKTFQVETQAHVTIALRTVFAIFWYQTSNIYTIRFM